MYLDRHAEIGRPSIPEVGQLQLPGRVREGRIEYELDCKQKIAFSDSILPEQHDIAR